MKMLYWGAMLDGKCDRIISAVHNSKVFDEATIKAFDDSRKPDGSYTLNKGDSPIINNTKSLINLIRITKKLYMDLLKPVINYSETQGLLSRFKNLVVLGAKAGYDFQKGDIWTLLNEIYNLQLSIGQLKTTLSSFPGVNQGFAPFIAELQQEVTNTFSPLMQAVKGTDERLASQDQVLPQPVADNQGEEKYEAPASKDPSINMAHAKRAIEKFKNILTRYQKGGLAMVGAVADLGAIIRELQQLDLAHAEKELKGEFADLLKNELASLRPLLTETARWIEVAQLRMGLSDSVQQQFKAVCDEYTTLAGRLDLPKKDVEIYSPALSLQVKQQELARKSDNYDQAKQALNFIESTTLDENTSFADLLKLENHMSTYFQSVETWYYEKEIKRLIQQRTGMTDLVKDIADLEQALLKKSTITTEDNQNLKQLYKLKEDLSKRLENAVKDKKFDAFSYDSINKTIVDEGKVPTKTDQKVVPAAKVKTIEVAKTVLSQLDKDRNHVQSLVFQSQNQILENNANETPELRLRNRIYNFKPDDLYKLSLNDAKKLAEEVEKYAPNAGALFNKILRSVGEDRLGMSNEIRNELLEPVTISLKELEHANLQNSLQSARNSLYNMLTDDLGGYEASEMYLDNIAKLLDIKKDDAAKLLVANRGYGIFSEDFNTNPLILKLDEAIKYNKMMAGRISVVEKHPSIEEAAVVKNRKEWLEDPTQAPKGPFSLTQEEYTSAKNKLNALKNNYDKDREAWINDPNSEIRFTEGRYRGGNIEQFGDAQNELVLFLNNQCLKNSLGPEISEIKPILPITKPLQNIPQEVINKLSPKLIKLFQPGNEEKLVASAPKVKEELLGLIKNYYTAKQQKAFENSFDSKSKHFRINVDDSEEIKSIKSIVNHVTSIEKEPSPFQDLPPGLINMLSPALSKMLLPANAKNLPSVASDVKARFLDLIRLYFTEKQQKAFNDSFDRSTKSYKINLDDTAEIKSIKSIVNYLNRTYPIDSMTPPELLKSLQERNRSGLSYSIADIKEKLVNIVKPPHFNEVDVKSFGASYKKVGREKLNALGLTGVQEDDFKSYEIKHSDPIIVNSIKSMINALDRTDALVFNLQEALRYLMFKGGASISALTGNISGIVLTLPKLNPIIDDLVRELSDLNFHLNQLKMSEQGALIPSEDFNKVKAYIAAQYENLKTQLSAIPDLSRSGELVKQIERLNDLLTDKPVMVPAEVKDKSKDESVAKYQLWKSASTKVNNYIEKFLQDHQLENAIYNVSTSSMFSNIVSSFKNDYLLKLSYVKINDVQYAHYEINEKAFAKLNISDVEKANLRNAIILENALPRLQGVLNNLANYSQGGFSYVTGGFGALKDLYVIYNQLSELDWNSMTPAKAALAEILETYQPKLEKIIMSVELSKEQLGIQSDEISIKIIQICRQYEKLAEKSGAHLKDRYPYFKDKIASFEAENEKLNTQINAITTVADSMKKDLSELSLKYLIELRNNPVFNLLPPSSIYQYKTDLDKMIRTKSGLDILGQDKEKIEDFMAELLVERNTLQEQLTHEKRVLHGINSQLTQVRGLIEVLGKPQSLTWDQIKELHELLAKDNPKFTIKMLCACLANTDQYRLRTDKEILITLLTKQEETLNDQLKANITLSSGLEKKIANQDEKIALCDEQLIVLSTLENALEQKLTEAEVKKQWDTVDNLIATRLASYTQSLKEMEQKYAPDLQVLSNINLIESTMNHPWPLTPDQIKHMHTVLGEKSKLEDFVLDLSKKSIEEQRVYTQKYLNTTFVKTQKQNGAALESDIKSMERKISDCKQQVEWITSLKNQTARIKESNDFCYIAHPHNIANRGVLTCDRSHAANAVRMTSQEATNIDDYVDSLRARKAKNEALITNAKNEVSARLKSYADEFGQCEMSFGIKTGTLRAIFDIEPDKRVEQFHQVDHLGGILGRFLERNSEQLRGSGIEGVYATAIKEAKNDAEVADAVKRVAETQSWGIGRFFRKLFGVSNIHDDMYNLSRFFKEEKNYRKVFNNTPEDQRLNALQQQENANNKPAPKKGR